MYDILIVGAGTAGITAGIYGARSGRKVIILEGNMHGGQIITAELIENYPGIPKISGADFANDLYEQAKQTGIEIRYEKVNEVENIEHNFFVVKTAQDTYETKTIIIATGAKNRPLGIADEEAYTGKGISYCATCDGAFYKEKEVAVIGGGNSALEEALTLSKLCKKVYLIHRRDTFRAENHLIDEINQKKNIVPVMQAQVIKLIGNERLSDILIETKERKEILSVSGLFVAVGQMPDNAVFSKLVELDSHGYVVTNENCETIHPGIFAAGDCRMKKVRQLATAASDGAIAGLAASEYCDVWDMENRKERI